ncbi:hypothetical protein Tco_0122495 [Tanacetum coccineum]
MERKEEPRVMNLDIDIRETAIDLRITTVTISTMNLSLACETVRVVIWESPHGCNGFQVLYYIVISFQMCGPRTRVIFSLGNLNSLTFFPRLGGQHFPVLIAVAVLKPDAESLHTFVISGDVMGLANADGSEVRLAAVYRPPSPTRRFLLSTLLGSISFCVSGSMSWFSLSSGEALHETLKPCRVWLVRVLEMNCELVEVANCLDGNEVNVDVKGTSVEDIVGEKRGVSQYVI